MSIIEVPIGPQHPALKEPLNFTFEVEGECVVGVKFRLGYNHRGIEKLAETKNYIQNTLLSARVCGICTYAHTTCYTTTVEKLMGVDIPERAQYIRVIMAELERIHSHLLWLGVMMHEIGFDTLFMYYWRDREQILDLFEIITGSRVQHAMNTVGGVRRDITQEEMKIVMKSMDRLEKRMKYYKNVTLRERTIRIRSEDVGILKPEDAIALCAVGPTLRASKIKSDVRFDDPYVAYDRVSFEVCTGDGYDVFSRILVRIDEVFESIRIIRQALEGMPSGAIRIKVPMRAEGEVVGRVEAPRGELMYYIRGDGTSKPYRVKIRTPTLANIPALCKMLEGCYIADIPAIIASIDPCIACMDRITILRNDKIEVWNWNKLRRYGIKWYGKH